MSRSKSHAAKNQSGIRDRIVELRRVRAGDLVPNEQNWRLHPDGQRDALRAVLADIGYADALLAFTAPDGRLKLFDGHLRQSLDPEQVVPVLVTDLTEAEARLMMLIVDPMTALAEADNDALGKLLLASQSEDEAIQALLEGLAEENPNIQPDTTELPDINETTRHTVVVPYDDADIPVLKAFLGVDELPAQLGKAISERIKGIVATGKDQ